MNTCALFSIKISTIFPYKSDLIVLVFLRWFVRSFSVVFRGQTIWKFIPMDHYLLDAHRISGRNRTKMKNWTWNQNARLFGRKLMRNAVLAGRNNRRNTVSVYFCFVFFFFFGSAQHRYLCLCIIHEKCATVLSNIGFYCFSHWVCLCVCAFHWVLLHGHDSLIKSNGVLAHKPSSRFYKYLTDWEGHVRFRIQRSNRSFTASFSQ